MQVIAMNVGDRTAWPVLKPLRRHCLKVGYPKKVPHRTKRRALLNQEAVANALDAFGQPFTVELSGEAWTESSDAPLAYVTSVGFDGKPRTDDDLAWRIELDGTVTPVNANN